MLIVFCHYCYCDVFFPSLRGTKQSRENQQYQIVSQATGDRFCNALVFCIFWIASQARNDGMGDLSFLRLFEGFFYMPLAMAVGGYRHFVLFDNYNGRSQLQCVKWKLT